MIDAYVIGAYSTPFGKHPDQSFTDLADQAVRGALRDADRPNTTDGPGSVWFGNMMMDHWGQRSSRGHFTLLPLMDAGALPEGRRHHQRRGRVRDRLDGTPRRGQRRPQRRTRAVTGDRRREDRST
ncbi:hypothetical protein ACFOJ6_14555 [Gordonia humi]|uniref:hypothetical protein n=1 Tax=Gordonia humi TaxID=686429 RepID=UPI00360776B1